MCPSVGEKNDFAGSLQKVNVSHLGIGVCMTSERKQRSLNLAHQMRTYRFWAAKGLVSLRRGAVSDVKALANLPPTHHHHVSGIQPQTERQGIN